MMVNRTIIAMASRYTYPTDHSVIDSCQPEIRYPMVPTRARGNPKALDVATALCIGTLKKTISGTITLKPPIPNMPARMPATVPKIRASNYRFYHRGACVVSVVCPRLTPSPLGSCIASWRPSGSIRITPA